jgi:hypothetical protein
MAARLAYGVPLVEEKIPLLQKQDQVQKRTYAGAVGANRTVSLSEGDAMELFCGQVVELYRKQPKTVTQALAPVQEVVRTGAKLGINDAISGLIREANKIADNCRAVKVAAEGMDERLRTLETTSRDESDYLLREMDTRMKNFELRLDSKLRGLADKGRKSMRTADPEEEEDDEEMGGLVTQDRERYRADRVRRRGGSDPDMEMCPRSAVRHRPDKEKPMQKDIHWSEGILQTMMDSMEGGARSDLETYLKEKHPEAESFLKTLKPSQNE